MNAGGTFSTAMLRALWVALGTFAATFVYLYGQYRITPEFPHPIGWSVEHAAYGGLAAIVGSTAVRGLFEGLIDRGRQASGDVLPSDVQPDGAGKP